MACMWKRAALLLVMTISGVAVASADTGDPAARRAAVRGGLSIRLAPGWQLRRAWLSDVIEPIPRLAVASFPVRLSRRTCECGMPNVRGFPRDGAFLFMWEYPHPSRRMLAQFPHRPARFQIGSGRPQRSACAGPSDEISFQDAGRAFQAEIYLGPAAGAGIRARLLATMDSLRVASGPGA
jgi:hypothetical protein